jgi:ribonuclease P protein component
VLQRLKNRRDFLAAARGAKVPARAFVLEARRREDEGPARFGFTVSKRTAAKAVERNRIRRRLRESVRLVAPEHARPGHDYVLVGRRSALTAPFADIRADVADALERAAAPKSPRGRDAARSPGR